MEAGAYCNHTIAGGEQPRASTPVLAARLHAARTATATSPTNTPYPASYVHSVGLCIITISSSGGGSTRAANLLPFGLSEYARAQRHRQRLSPCCCCCCRSSCRVRSGGDDASALQIGVLAVVVEAVPSQDALELAARSRVVARRRPPRRQVEREGVGRACRRAHAHCRLVPQQVPLVAFSGNFVLPFETELVLNDDEVVYDVDGNSYMKMAWLDRRDSSGAMFNRISRAICSVSGRELGVARQDMWSRSSWTVHTSDDVQLARIRMASGTARLSLATEELSVHFGCECGRDCFVVFRGDPLQCQVLASACRSAKDGVYRVRVSPFVDYVLMCVFARCVQLSGR